MANKFREKFDFTKISKEIYRWFPGHMAKGLRKMYESLPTIDAAIEVHDARVIAFFKPWIVYSVLFEFKKFQDPIHGS